MIDLHCHLLPGLDDGPGDPAKSLEMCRMALEEGVSGIAATPHLYHDLFPTDRDSILAALQGMRGALEEAGVCLALYAGADVRLVPDLAERLDRGECLTLNHGRYFLLELPHRVLPPNLGDAVSSLVAAGRVPVITHPERNAAILRREEILLDLLGRGALCQVTAGSLTGEFGRESERLARRLVEAGAVHFLASDAHSTSWRPPGLARGLDAARRLLGDEAARRLVDENPRAVLADLPLEVAPVRTLPRPRRFWFF